MEKGCAVQIQIQTTKNQNNTISQRQKQNIMNQIQKTINQSQIKIQTSKTSSRNFPGLTSHTLRSISFPSSLLLNCGRSKTN